VKTYLISISASPLGDAFADYLRILGYLIDKRPKRLKTLDSECWEYYVTTCPPKDIRGHVATYADMEKVGGTVTNDAVVFREHPKSTCDDG
jgi:hypothetical protein